MSGREERGGGGGRLKQETKRETIPLMLVQGKINRTVCCVRVCVFLPEMNEW